MYVNTNTPLQEGKYKMSKTKLFDALPKGPIAEILIQRITDALISGELQPGDKIPTEVEFSEKLGVSRNAVREAIKVLVAFGILEIRRPEGTFVVDKFSQKLFDPMIYGILASKTNKNDLLEFKISCALSAMYLAIRNASPESISQLREYGLAFKDAMNDDSLDLDAKYEASMKFNFYLGEMSGNMMMVQLDDIVYRISKYSRYQAIEATIKNGIPNALPDNYLKQVDIIEAGDMNAIPQFLDERLALWKSLLEPEE